MTTPPACLPVLRHDSFEFVGHVHDFGGVFVALYELGELLLLLHGFGERHANLEGDHLGEPIRQPERLALHSGHIAHHSRAAIVPKVDDLAHCVVAIALGHMSDHFLAAFHAEIDVEIRHGDPFGVQQPLEQEVVFQRIQFRDAKQYATSEALRKPRQPTGTRCSRPQLTNSCT